MTGHLVFIDNTTDKRKGRTLSKCLTLRRTVQNIMDRIFFYYAINYIQVDENNWLTVVLKWKV